MELKDIIVDRMKDLGINSEDLSKKMNVAPSTISRYINGDITNIRRDKIKKLADALEIDVSYLMGWKKYNGNTQNDPLLELAPWIGNLVNINNEELINLLTKISKLTNEEIHLVNSLVDKIIK